MLVETGYDLEQDVRCPTSTLVYCLVSQGFPGFPPIPFSLRSTRRTDGQSRISLLCPFGQSWAIWLATSRDGTDVQAPLGSSRIREVPKPSDVVFGIREQLLWPVLTCAHLRWKQWLTVAFHQSRELSRQPSQGLASDDVRDEVQYRDGQIQRTHLQISLVGKVYSATPFFDSRAALCHRFSALEWDRLSINIVPP